MKITEKFLRIGLIFLVLLSLYFSMNIWVSSAKKEQPLKTETQVPTVVNERANTDVFLPLRLARMVDGQTEMNNSENLIASVQTEIKKSSFGPLAQIVTEDAIGFNQFLTIEKGIELTYDGPFSIQEYLSIYDLDLDHSALSNDTQTLFNCIQIDLNQQKIRFLDFSGKNVYEAPISINGEDLLAILNKTSAPYTKIANQKIIEEQHYYLSEKIQLKKYSYILASQPVTKFRNAFFSDTEDIQTNEDSEDFSYSSGNERLVVDENRGTVHFNGTMTNQNSEGNLYSESFSYIKKLGTNMGNLRYFDRDNTQINYRTFVEGYPVFSENNKGQVQISIENADAASSDVVIDTSVDTIQVPIPSDEEVTLGSTEDILTNLKANNIDISKINSMVIGYTWHKIEELNQVVDLTPEWYIHYENKWYSEPDLLKEFAKSEVN